MNRKNIKKVYIKIEEYLINLIENVEQFANNLNKSYYAHFIKLCKSIKNKLFSEQYLMQLPILPTNDPREDFESQNNQNKNITNYFKKHV